MKVKEGEKCEEEIKWRNIKDEEGEEEKRKLEEKKKK